MPNANATATLRAIEAAQTDLQQQINNTRNAAAGASDPIDDAWHRAQLSGLRHAAQLIADIDEAVRMPLDPNAPAEVFQRALLDQMRETAASTNNICTLSVDRQGRWAYGDGYFSSERQVTPMAAFVEVARLHNRDDEQNFEYVRTQYEQAVARRDAYAAMVGETPPEIPEIRRVTHEEIDDPNIWTFSPTKPLVDA